MLFEGELSNLQGKAKCLFIPFIIFDAPWAIINYSSFLPGIFNFWLCFLFQSQVIRYSVIVFKCGEYVGIHFTEHTHTHTQLLMLVWLDIEQNNSQYFKGYFTSSICRYWWLEFIAKVCTYLYVSNFIFLEILLPVEF